MTIDEARAIADLSRRLLKAFLNAKLAQSIADGWETSTSAEAVRWREEAEREIWIRNVLENELRDLVSSTRTVALDGLPRDE